VLFLRYYALRSVTGTARASRPPAHIMQSSNAFALPSDPSETRPRQTCLVPRRRKRNISHVAPMRSLVKVLRWS